MDRFTQNLRRARKAAGLTQQQLADRLHVTRQSVSSWELGRTEPDLQTLTELAEVFETDAGSLLGEAGRPAYPRLQKRFVTGFAVCAGLLLMLFCLELGLFAYWRKLALHDYGVALYAALWKLSVPPLLWYSSGVGAVCFFAMWSPVRCGKQARLALLLAALALGLPVLALMAQYLAVALGNLDGVRVWLAPLLRRPAGKLAIQIILPGLIGVCTGLFACSERSVLNGLLVFHAGNESDYPAEHDLSGKVFLQTRAGTDQYALWLPYGAFDEKSGHMAVRTSLFWKAVV